MTPIRLAAILAIIAWVPIFGLLAGWDNVLFTTAIVLPMNLIVLSYNDNASEQSRRVMRRAGLVVGTVVAFGVRDRDRRVVVRTT